MTTESLKPIWFEKITWERVKHLYLLTAWGISFMHIQGVLIRKRRRRFLFITEWTNHSQAYNLAEEIVWKKTAQESKRETTAATVNLSPAVEMKRRAGTKKTDRMIRTRGRNSNKGDISTSLHHLALSSETFSTKSFTRIIRFVPTISSQFLITCFSQTCTTWVHSKTHQPLTLWDSRGYDYDFVHTIMTNG